MSAIAEIGSSAERSQDAIGPIERIAVPEVVVPDKELMFLRDLPIEPDIHPLRVLHGLRRRQQVGRDAD